MKKMFFSILIVCSLCLIVMPVMAQETATQVMAKSVEVFTTATSYQQDVLTNIAGEMNGEPQMLENWLTVRIVHDPFSFGYMSQSTEGEISHTVEGYILPDADQYLMCIQGDENGLWTCVHYPEEQVMPQINNFLAMGDLSAYTDCITEYQFLPEDEIDGIPVYVIEGTASGDDLTSLLGRMTGADPASDQFKQLFPDTGIFGEIRYRRYVDKQTYAPVREFIDISSFMEAISRMRAETTGDANAVLITHQETLVNFSSFNTLPAVTLPEDAAATQPLN